jgi:hypothetical protein
MVTLMKEQRDLFGPVRMVLEDEEIGREEPRSSSSGDAGSWMGSFPSYETFPAHQP